MNEFIPSVLISALSSGSFASVNAVHIFPAYSYIATDLTRRKYITVFQQH
jgi:hypothetical protein